MKIMKKLVAIVSALAIATTTLTTTTFAASTNTSVPYGTIYNECGHTRNETLQYVTMDIAYEAIFKEHIRALSYSQNYNHKDIAGVVIVSQTDLASLYSAPMLCQYYNCILVFAEDTIWAEEALQNFNGYESNTFNIFTLSTGKNNISNDTIKNIQRYNEKVAIKTKVTNIIGSNKIDTNTKVINYIINNKKSNELNKQNDKTICIINQNSYSDIASAYNLDKNILYMLVSNKLTNSQKTICKKLGYKDCRYMFFGSTNNLNKDVCNATKDTSNNTYFRDTKISGADRYITNLKTVACSTSFNEYTVDEITRSLKNKEIFLVDGTSEVDCLITACTTAVCDRHKAYTILINKSNPKLLNSINASLKTAKVKTITSNNYNTIKNNSLFIAVGKAGNYAKL